MTNIDEEDVKSFDRRVVINWFLCIGISNNICNAFTPRNYGNFGLIIISNCLRNQGRLWLKQIPSHLWGGGGRFYVYFTLTL